MDSRATSAISSSAVRMQGKIKICFKSDPLKRNVPPLISSIFIGSMRLYTGTGMPKVPKIRALRDQRITEPFRHLVLGSDVGNSQDVL
jgi:hypothetical protein